jgi:hypothetical protein
LSRDEYLHGLGLTYSDINEFIQTMVDSGLIYREEDLIIALALPHRSLSLQA